MPVKSKSGQWETPQVVPSQLATEMVGGSAPSKEDIVRSANARAQKRHDMKGQDYADVGVLPDSNAMVGNEMVGIKDHGYLVKKNLPYGVNAFYNSLPPGEDIEDQEVCDIRRMPIKVFDRGLGYPGDGWTNDATGMQADTGRPGGTNDMGGGAS